MTSSRELRWTWAAAEVLLVASTIAAVRLLGRLFEDTTYLAPMIFAAVVCHAVLITLRWLGFGSFISALGSFAAVVLAIVATHYADSAAAVIVPTGATLTQFQADLQAAGDVFNSMQTPVPAVTGFVVIGSLAFWVLSVAADWAAFRLFSPSQALVPWLTVLIFVSLLGVEADRVRTTAALVVTGVLFVLAHRAASRAAQGIWLDQGPARGYTALMVAGSLVAMVAAAAGIIGGPSVPGADSAPLVEIGDEGRRENEPIEVISPLVQIQPRLVDQSDQVLFTVETNQRAYWRIAALDVFDGVLWRSQGQFRATDDGIDVAYGNDVPVDVLRSTFDLSGLNVVWAPAAYLPVDVDNLTNGIDLNYEAESATFIVDTNDQRTSDGLRYRVQSEVANFTPELLRQLPNQSADTIDPRYLALPGDFSPVAIAEAQRITAGLVDAYDKALALQDYFRQNFTYDIDVAKGHDIDRVEDFLQVQRGYCEQFAGTFAAMARAVGLPARVATGFTPGEQDPSNPDRYIVRGRHAHAWPEVWIAGAGWVAFEPTPGRGAPNATEYTGIPESQDNGPEPVAEAQQQQTELADEAEGAPDAPTPTPVPPEPLAEQPIEPQPEPEEVQDTDALDRGTSRSLLILLATVVLALGWMIGIPALKRWLDARRRARLGEDTRRLVTLTWASLVDRLERLGHPPEPTETLVEYCRRVERDYAIVAPDFAELTELTVAAAYDSQPPTEAETERAAILARGIHAAIDAEQPMLVRGAHEIDPRPLLRVGDPVSKRANRLAGGAIEIVDQAPAATGGSPEPSGDPLI